MIFEAQFTTSVQETMESVAMVEELAWLIKDNLPCKHLVLSAEEAFVSFLDPQETTSTGNVLTLEPMAAYHRMLLHRLADIFRLAHESIGEGENRRLVLGKCEDSYIPDVLVSDILECNEVAPSCFQDAPFILKRNKDCSDAQKFAGAQSGQISFEERQAAYLAARERIFADDVGHPMGESQSNISRPRAVPAVARRMIAHALGKRILAEQDSKAAAAHTGRVGTGALDSSCTSREESTEPTVVDVAMCCTVNTNDTISQLEPPKVVDYSQVKAAKRMFAQALGLGSSKSPCNISSRVAEKKVTDAECLQSGKGQIGLSLGPTDKSKSGRALLSGCDQSAGVAQLEQGKAAQRMLAQALGFRSLSIGVERSKGS